MKPRDLTVVVILLALGTVIYAFMPNIAGVTPDMVYVFTTLALLLVRPKIGFALAIGMRSAKALLCSGMRRYYSPRGVLEVEPVDAFLEGRRSGRTANPGWMQV